MEYRKALLSKISEINSELITRNDLALIETLLFGDNSFSQYDNSRILLLLWHLFLHLKDLMTLFYFDKYVRN